MKCAVAVLVLALAGCPGDDAAATTWAPLADDLDVVALSVQGRAADDVWIVGGPLGVGTAGALARHWDGSRWTTADVGITDTLWWVWTAADDTTWMVGE